LKIEILLNFPFPSVDEYFFSRHALIVQIAQQPLAAKMNLPSSYAISTWMPDSACKAGHRS
jgi:hypothetical protein